MNHHHPDTDKSSIQQVTIKIALRTVSDEPPVILPWYKTWWQKILSCFER